MNKVRYRTRRTGTGFQIEDTTTGECSGDYDDFFVASQAAGDRERDEAVDALARQVEEAGGSDTLAADIRNGVQRDVLLRRLHEGGEGDTPAAKVLAKAGEKTPRRGPGTGRWG